MRLRNLLALIIAGAGSLTLAAATTEQKAPPAPPARNPNDIEIPLCTVRWLQDVVVSAEVDGLLKKRHKNEGDEVKEGDVLAQLDSRAAELAVRAAKTDVNHLGIEITDAIDRLEEQKAQRDTTRHLRDKGASNPEEYRLAEVRVKVAANQVELKKFEHEKAQVQHDRAQFELERHTVRSPLQGRIMECFKHEGSLVERGAREGLQLFRIVRTDRIRIEGNIDANKVDYLRVRRGQPVSVELELPPAVQDPRLVKKVFTGEVSFLGRFDVSNQAKQVWADIENPGGLLEDGLAARMIIHTGTPPAQAKR
jgi:macrolide-specific efflux system membrane fusion protein